MTPVPGRDNRPLVVHLVFRFSVGGLENGLVNLINHMPAHRWRHAVVSMTGIDRNFARRIERPDVPLFELHKPPGQGFWLYPALYRLMRRLRPDVVHTRNLAALEGQVPAFAAGVPVRVHGEHGRDIEDLDGSSKRHQWMRRMHRPFVHRYVALSRDLAGYLQERIGIPAERITQIYNGVDIRRFHAVPQRCDIAGSPFNGQPGLWLAGTVGRMQTVKAQPDLVAAFVRVLTAHPELRARLRLVLVGDGPLRADCAAMLQAAGMANLAWFAGERSDVPDVMRGLDCFVLPSVAEGISNTILESMASGLPVIATAVGGNADLVVDGQTGVIVPPGNPDRLAAALASMAGQPDAAAAQGLQGRRVLEARFSLDAMVAAYDSVYDSLLRRVAG